MEVLVITGGIGSGKSEACRIIQETYGCGVYSADSKVKDLYYRYPGIVTEIEFTLDVALRGDDGVFIPGLLADVIFNDRKALESVEKIVFPALVADFEAWSERYFNDAFVVFESATILEKTYFKDFGDKIILIDAPFEMRLERACKRDTMSKEKILTRMQNQPMMNMISEGRILSEADVVICNDGDIHSLKQKLTQAIDNIFCLNR